MSQHRVLHVLTHLIHGGTEFYVLRQVSALDPSRMSAEVAFVSARRDIAHLYEAAGVFPTSLEHRHVFDAPRTLWRLVRLIRDLDINVVQTHSRHDRLYGHMAALLTGRPVVDTLHSEFAATRHEASRRNPALTARIRIRLEDILRSSVVREVIAVSQSVATVWKQIGSVHDPVDRVRVVAPTIDFGPHPPDRSDREAILSLLGVDHASPVLISVGRLVGSKNHALLVPTMEAVVRRHPHAVLLIVGSGELRGQLTELVAAAGLEAHVRFLGRETTSRRCWRRATSLCSLPSPKASGSQCSRRPPRGCRW